MKRKKDDIPRDEKIGRLMEIIARSWCDGYRAAKDSNRDNVIPDFLTEAEGDFGERSARYALKALEYYNVRGELGLEELVKEHRAIDEIPRPTK